MQNKEGFFIFFLDLRELPGNVQLENNLHMQTHTQITGCSHGASENVQIQKIGYSHSLNESEV